MSPRVQATLIVDKFLTEKEVDKLLHYSSRLTGIQSALYIYIYIAIHTGMRVSEILNLTIDDMKQGYVIINNKGKIRSVPLSIVAAKCIEYHNNNNNKTSSPSSPPSPSSYIFSTNRKSTRPVFLTSTIHSWLKQVPYKKYKIPKEKLHTHNFRHYFISTSIKKGMKPLTVKNISGHSSLDTLSIYYNETTTELDNEIRKVHCPPPPPPQKVSPPKKRGSKPGVKRGKYNKPLRDLTRALQEQKDENKKLLQLLSTLTK